MLGSLGELTGLRVVKCAVDLFENVVHGGGSAIVGRSVLPGGSVHLVLDAQHPLTLSLTVLTTNSLTLLQQCNNNECKLSSTCGLFE